MVSEFRYVYLLQPWVPKSWYVYKINVFNRKLDSVSVASDKCACPENNVFVTYTGVLISVSICAHYFVFRRQRIKIQKLQLNTIFAQLMLCTIPKSIKICYTKAYKKKTLIYLFFIMNLFGIWDLYMWLIHNQRTAQTWQPINA